MDPIEPNVDPILQQEIAWLGTAMANELTAQGKMGVIIHAIYDAWTPARAYQHYHGGIRILTEAASCKIASPVQVPFISLSSGIGYDAKRASWNHPMPWPGGEWHLSDIMEYEAAATYALLTHVARYRDTWLQNFYLIGKKAVTRTEGPYAFIIAAQQRDPATTARLLDVLHTGMVELHYAKEQFYADERLYDAGSIIVMLQQPYGAFAKTLLERQHYPDIRQYPGGPPQRPYDVTAHTLPLLMGVDVHQIDRPFEADLAMLTTTSLSFPLPTLEGDQAYIISANQNMAFAAANILLAQGSKVYRTPHSFETSGHCYSAGTWVIPDQKGIHEMLASLSDRGLVIDKGMLPKELAITELTPKRLGVYKSWTAAMDEGWLRYTLEQYDFGYTSLTNQDIQNGNLHTRYDVIVLPSMPEAVIYNGHRQGTVPEPFWGGLGDAGVAALKAFMAAGGTLIALEQAAAFAADYLDLPVCNVLADVPPEHFYIPGSILKVLIDPNHPLGYGTTTKEAIWFQRAPAFALDAGRSIASYPASNILLSGWILGENLLQGRTALAELTVGQGKAILFGFNPHYRAQAYGTYKILFNAIMNS